MGLDLVELVMAVEEEFGIELPDAEAEKLVTPALLTEFILTRVEMAEQSVCLSRKAFYALRRVLMREFDCTRAQVKPDNRLEFLIPRSNRRAAWRRAQTALQAERWPELWRPRWVVAALCAVFGGSVAAGRWAGLGWWVAALVAVAPWLGAYWLTQPFRTEFPKGCRTAGELARLLVAPAPKLFDPPGRRWSREEVAAMVRRLTVEHLGLKPEDYWPEGRFIEDFGAG